MLNLESGVASLKDFCTPGNFIALLNEYVHEADAIGHVLSALESPLASVLQEPVTGGGKPVKNRFGLFLVSAPHINNHIGQIVYLLHAFEVP